MTLQLWLSFTAATIVLLLIPGPTVLQCIGDALQNRDRQRWSTIAGVGAGDTIAMTLSLCGAGALLEVSSAAFTVLKSLGALYLLYLGIRAILTARLAHAQDLRFAPLAEPESALARFIKTTTITMLNPKGILFFVAFVPQFVSPRAAFVPQAALLLATFVFLAMLNAWMYMSLAGVLSSRLQTASAQRKVGYASGGVLLAAGGLTLALRRS
jgi:threonine/homoserine/homoserine lactone efflux protein